MMHRDSRVFASIVYSLLVLLNVLFQAVLKFEYRHEEIAAILGQLSMNWSAVVSHLRFADRVKAFKYHMKEVLIDSIFRTRLSIRFFKVFPSFQPKSLDETIYKDKTYPAKLFLIRNVLLHCKFFPCQCFRPTIPRFDFAPV